MYVRGTLFPPLPSETSDLGGGLRAPQDPTNPATFSQINAELERHLQLPGIGNQGDATPVTLQHYNR